MSEFFLILNNILLFTALILWLEGLFSWKRVFTALLIAISLIFSFCTEQGEIIPVWLNSMFLQLSISSYCLLAYYIVNKLLSNNNSPSPLLGHCYNYALVAIAGIVFYLFSLGFSSLDPYRIGYNALLPATITSAIAVYMAWKDSARGCLILVMVVACYAGGILESTNFWDYLFDPLLIIYTSAYSLKRSTDILFCKKPSQTT